jgi:hypothetical protein
MDALAENNMNRTAAAWLALAGILSSTSLGAACPPTGMSREQLLELQAREFAVAHNARRQALALDLVPCLGSADPALRDKSAFEARAAWVRGKPLTAGPQLAADFPDPTGVQRPFAILVLAEVVRVDRVEPFMTDGQLQQLVDASTRYLQSVRDYRGFDEREGWRHGVAHSSDLMLQLAVNPRTSKAQLDQLLAAIASQIAPPGEHFYVYGEGNRLAQAVVALYR